MFMLSRLFRYSTGFGLVLFIAFMLSSTTACAVNPTPGTRWKGDNKVIKRLHNNMPCKRIGVQKIKPFKLSKRKLRKNAKSIKSKDDNYTPMPKFRANHEQRRK